MKHTRIEEHIDNRIKAKLGDGIPLVEIKEDMKNRIEDFASRDTFSNLPKFELLKNWETMNFRTRYHSYYAMFSSKRLVDIQWAIDNKAKFGLSDRKLFNLIKFKEKLK